MEDVPLEPFQTHGLAQENDSLPPIGNSTIGIATAIEPANTVAALSGVNSLQAGSFASSSAMHMLQSLNAFVEDKKDKVKWMRSLPEVNVKQEYLSFKPPRAKCEGALRADWPTVLRSDICAAPSFNEYMKEFKNKKIPQVSEAANGVGRALGALEIKPTDQCPEPKVDSVEVLVALQVSGNHIKLVNSPLFDAKFGFASGMVDGLELYAQMHLRALNQATARANPYCKDFQRSLENFVADIKSCFHKREKESKALLHRMKQQADLKVVKSIDIKRMQTAVLKGYVVLKRIEATFGNRPLPKRVRGKANAAMAGAINFDTFPGRKKEWEIMKFDYVMEVLAEMGNCLVCPDHKTAACYGSIAKYLTPGLLEAFITYARLHRPEDCTTFLVPAFFNAPKVCLPSALRSWCAEYLDDDQPRVTCNQARKLFHKTLWKLTADKEKCKEIFVVLDAHSKKVQGAHYILQDPEDDIILAKELVKSVLGKTVAWPSDDDVSAHSEVCNRVLNAKDVADEVAEVDSEDEAMEYFPGSERWGKFAAVDGGMLAIVDGIVDDDGVGAASSGQQDVPVEHADPAKRSQSKAGDALPAAEQQIVAAGAIASDGRTMDQVHADYNPPPNDGLRTRTFVSPEAKNQMREHLRWWQLTNGKNANAKPSSSIWYRDLRIALIDEGFLERSHCLGVCRNFAKDYVKTQPNIPASDAEVQGASHYAVPSDTGPDEGESAMPDMEESPEEEDPEMDGELGWCFCYDICVQRPRCVST